MMGRRVHPREHAAARFTWPERLLIAAAITAAVLVAFGAIVGAVAQ